jgi:hypothetical protein
MILRHKAGNHEPAIFEIPVRGFRFLLPKNSKIDVEVSARNPRQGRIACGLVMGHIVAHDELYGILEGTRLAGD